MHLFTALHCNFTPNFLRFWSYGPTGVRKMNIFCTKFGWGCNFSRRTKSGACSLRCKCKSVFDYNPPDAQKGIDFTHQGGAICKFSGDFTVKLVRTINIIIHIQKNMFSTRPSGHMTKSDAISNRNYKAPHIFALPEITFLRKRPHISATGRTRSRTSREAF